MHHITRFTSAKLVRSTFETCWCQQIDFTGADFKNAFFKNAQLTKSDFVFNHFENVDFTRASLRSDSLQNAVSIRDVRFPNGTLGYRQNWIENGDADCNRTSLDPWQIDNGNIAIMHFNESQCHFADQSTTTPVMMSQKMSLKDMWDSSFWSSSFVDLQAEMSDGVSIDLLGTSTNGTIINQQSASK